MEKKHSQGTRPLKTERLVLRRHKREDAAILFEQYQDHEEMYRYSGWNPYATREQAEETISGFLRSYEGEEPFYGWAIEFEEKLAGTIGAYDLDREQGSIEVGFGIFPAYQGQGLASEALRAVLEYLLKEEGIGSVRAWCALDNVASAKTMEKAGMKRERIQPGGLVVGERAYDQAFYGIRLAPGQG